MSKQPNDTDLLAGIRLRLRRDELRLTQSELARRVGMTFQQVQKYENGTNRISAGRLEAISRILEVPVDYFFPEAAPAPHVDAAELLETQGLLGDFAKIGSPSVRKAVRGLVKAIEAAERTTPA